MSIELHAGERRKILRQHRDLRLVLTATIKTAGADRSDGQQLQSLVALGLKLGRMMGRHSAFEEAALRAHLAPGGADLLQVEALASRQRKEVMDLTLLTKLAFESRDAGRLLPAFRRLSQNILEQIDKEERALFRKPLVTKPNAQRSEPRQSFTPEITGEAVAVTRNLASA